MKLKRILIVTENASMQMGGEASLALYYFRLMRSHQLDAHLICHERVKEELNNILPNEDFSKIHFVKDNWLQSVLYEFSNLFPRAIKTALFEPAIHFLTQIKVRKVAKVLIQELKLQAVLEPSPISPKTPSLMYNLGVPVVIGPLCGGLEFPPAFQYMDSRFSRFVVHAGRIASNLLNRLMPGKLNADALIVANPRTAAALPTGCQGHVYEVIESGVDLDIWEIVEQDNSPDERLDDCSNDAPIRFIFSGRFVDWKGIQFLIEAFQPVVQQCNVVLELVGDGELRPALEAYVQEEGIAHAVKFHGWKSRPESAALIQECDVFVMPSLRECGGTAILEAMAMGLPVIATDWAGPAIYVSHECGIKVKPTSLSEFVQGLADAMTRLAQSPDLRQQMGAAAQQRVKSQYFDWDSKVVRVIEILQETVNMASSAHQPTDQTSGRPILSAKYPACHKS